MAELTPTAPPVRLRLVFAGRRLLRRAQRQEGLRHCWLLLRPELATVAALADHLVRRFRLRRSCPHGVLLSVRSYGCGMVLVCCIKRLFFKGFWVLDCNRMDEFILPPFESTCIFRDNDIIRVKQKLCKKIVKHNDAHCIQDSEIVEKLPLPTNGEILAIKYLEDSREKEQAGPQHEENETHTQISEDEDTSSKRKWQDAENLESSKKKKSKLTDAEEHIICRRNDEGVHIGQDQDSKRMKCSQQNCSKPFSSVGTGIAKATMETKASIVLEEVQKAEGQIQQVPIPADNTSNGDRWSNQTEMNCQTKVVTYNAECATKKVPTRSARRKKIKREYRQKAKHQLRENLQSQESPTAVDCPLSSNPNNSHFPSSSHEAAMEECDTSDELVPVVVRPGHIRFESAGESIKSQGKAEQETLQWNGTISKKKGQKWGIDNSKKTDDSCYYGRMTARDENNHVKVSKTTDNSFYGTSNQKVVEHGHDESASIEVVAEEGEPNTGPLDFESLYPLTRFPKEGDLIVYRLVELSSSWCPELSPYRVGEVMIYDPVYLRIILLPVPDYPIITDENKDVDESDMQLDMPPPYKEDGSLEIEYSSLLDVRLLKDSESIPAPGSTPLREKGKGVPMMTSSSVLGKGKKDEPQNCKQVTVEKNKGKICSQEVPLVSNNNKDSADAQGSTPHTNWEVGQASDKKVGLEENGWGPWTPNTNTSSWSYRAMRGCALGPTVALLRGKNNQKGKFSNPKFSK